jgi:hypothetical protein
MQIISLELDHYNFYSPSTGGVILDGDMCYDNEPSLWGYWLDEFWGEPTINNKYLIESWHNYLSNLESLKKSDTFTNEFEALEGFFKELQFQNVIVFKITDHLPYTPTAYFVIDMNYINAK